LPVANEYWQGRCTCSLNKHLANNFLSVVGYTTNEQMKVFFAVREPCAIYAHSGHTDTNTHRPVNCARAQQKINRKDLFPRKIVVFLFFESRTNNGCEFRKVVVQCRDLLYTDLGTMVMCAPVSMEDAMNNARGVCTLIYGMVEDFEGLHVGVGWTEK
jgi:hypothetical protein